MGASYRRKDSKIATTKNTKSSKDKNKIQNKNQILKLNIKLYYISITQCRAFLEDY